jgi:glutaredoxin
MVSSSVALYQRTGVQLRAPERRRSRSDKPVSCNAQSEQWIASVVEPGVLYLSSDELIESPCDQHHPTSHHPKHAPSLDSVACALHKPLPCLATVEVRSGKRRCSAHGLALGPGGECVLCRRDSLRVPGSSAPVRLLVVAGAALVSAVGFAAYWTKAPGRNGGAIEPEVREEVVEAAEPPPPTDEPAEPTPALKSDFRGVGFERTEAPEPAPAPAPSETAPAASASSTAPEAVPGPDPRQLGSRAHQALSLVSIQMYATSWCPSCRRARAWLQANSVRFVEYDVERSAAAERRLRQLNPKGSVPTIEVDGRVLVGFGEQSMGRAIADAVERRIERDR